MTNIVKCMSLSQLLKKANYGNWSLPMTALLHPKTWDMVENGYQESLKDQE